VFRFSPILKLFLTCEQTEEFETFKARRVDPVRGNSVLLESLKSFAVRDTVSLLYSMAKSKLFAKKESVDIQSVINLDDVLRKIDKHVPALNLMAKQVELRIAYLKQQISRQEDLVTTLHNIVDDSDEVQQLHDHVKEYHAKHNELLKAPLARLTV
jgi:hypothetical protein